MQCFTDELVGDVRPVEVAGVDVIHTRRHRLAKHRKRCIAVLWRSKYTGSSQLHGAVAHPGHLAVTQRESPRFHKVGHVASRKGAAGRGHRTTISVDRLRDNPAKSARAVRKTEQ